MTDNIQTSNELQNINELINNLPGVTFKCLIDESWTMNFISHQCFKLTGYHAKQYLEKEIAYADLIITEDVEKVDEKNEEVVEKVEEKNEEVVANVQEEDINTNVDSTNEDIITSDKDKKTPALKSKKKRNSAKRTTSSLSEILYLIKQNISYRKNVGCKGTFIYV